MEPYLIGLGYIGIFYLCSWVFGALAVVFLAIVHRYNGHRWRPSDSDVLFGWMFWGGGLFLLIISILFCATVLIDKAFKMIGGTNLFTTFKFKVSDAITWFAGKMGADVR